MTEKVREDIRQLWENIPTWLVLAVERIADGVTQDDRRE